MIDTHLGCIRGIAVLGGELFVAAETSPDIQVYDSTNFTPTRKIPVPASTGAIAMVACPHHNCLYVSNNAKPSVLHRFDLSNNSTTNWSLSEQCWGLSLTNNNNVLVTLHNVKRLQEYSTNGKLIRQIVLDLDNPWGIAQLSLSNE